MDFDTMVENDLKNVFLKEYSQIAIYTPNQGLPREVTIQFFEENLDKMEARYNHAWGAYSDLGEIAINDLFEILGVSYGVIDFAPDELNSGLNLFLQKV